MEDGFIKILSELDSSANFMDESKIYSNICDMTKDDDSFEAKSERLAFTFIEGVGSSDKFYQPIIGYKNENNEHYKYPSSADINKEILSYWTKRSSETKNNTMKARYTGLVLDFSDKKCFKMAATHIESLIKICEIGSEIDKVSKITRAYKVSRSIRDCKLQAKIIGVATQLESRIFQNDINYIGFCFKLLVIDNKRNNEVSDEKIQALVAFQEKKLLRFHEMLDHRRCKLVGVELATYYRRCDKNDKAKEIAKTVGDCYEKSCHGEQHPMKIATILQYAYDIYKEFDLTDRCKEVSKKILSNGHCVTENMQTVSTRTEISNDDMEDILKTITDGGIESALSNVTTFLPKKDEVKKQVKKLAQTTPMLYLVDRSFYSYGGRMEYKLGGLENDMENNITHQLSTNMSIDSFLLRKIFESMQSRYNFSAKTLCDFIFSSNLFKDYQKHIINKGFDAFLNKDYIVAIHLLIPQIETVIREFIKLYKGDVLKSNRHDGFQLRTMDDLIRDDIFKQHFGIDIVFYFRTILTDQVGWNLRNNVCHGISEKFDNCHADRIVHIFLILSFKTKGLSNG